MTHSTFTVTRYIFAILFITSALLVTTFPANAQTATNIALNKTTTASSVENTSRTAVEATDGKTNTRWASSRKDENWIMIDLGLVYALNGVKLHWETAYASSYQIQTSVDGSTWVNIYSTTQGKGSIENLSINGIGRYVRMNGIKRATEWGYSLWEFEVYGFVPNITNVARNKTATSSTFENNSRTANQAIDGNNTSRWASKAGDSNWITIDLGSKHAISRVTLNWEVAYGKQYQIQVSDNGSSWNTIFTENNSNGSIDDITLNASGRYVRMNGIKRATQWGYSLWEFEVYGYQTQTVTSSSSSVSSSSSSSVSSSTSTSSVSSPSSSSSNSSSSSVDNQAPTVPGGVSAKGFESRIEFSWTASTDNRGVTGYQVYRNNTKVADLSNAVRTYIDSNVVKDITYSYSVRARDAAGNWSALSSSANAKLIPSGELTLMWSNPTSRENGEYLELDEIGGYEIRYKKVTDSVYTTVVINNNDTNSYSMSQPSGSYEYEIATFDTTGLYSNFVSIQPE